MRAAGGVLVGVGVLALAAVSCGSNKYRYISNSDEGAFLRIPSSWELYDVGDEQPTDRPAPLTVSDDGAWTVAFDASPQPSPDHIGERAPTDVVGLVQIVPLSREARDRLSFKSMRATLLGGTDPLDVAQQGDPDLELILFEPVDRGPVHGDRTVVNIRNSDDAWVTLDQTVFTNEDSSRVYRLLVVCEASCYQENRSTIDAIVESWQVKE